MEIHTQLSGINIVNTQPVSPVVYISVIMCASWTGGHQSVTNILQQFMGGPWGMYISSLKSIRLTIFVEMEENSNVMTEERVGRCIVRQMVMSVFLIDGYIWPILLLVWCSPSCPSVCPSLQCAWDTHLWGVAPDVSLRLYKTRVSGVAQMLAMDEYIGTSYNIMTCPL